MKTLLVVVLVLVAAIPAFTKPVGTSLERLELLKAKLRGLEKELSSYDVKKTLDQPFLKDEPIAPEIKNDAHRQLLPPDLGVALQKFLSSLTEAERRLVEKMHSKIHLLKAALTAPTEPESNVPVANKSPDSDIERRGLLDDSVQAYLNTLSAEDRAKVEKIRSKLKYLLASLKDKLSTDPLDVEVEEPVIQRRGMFDKSLQDFLDQLKNDDRAIVTKIKSKLKYLLAAITNKNPSDPLDVESKVPSRRGLALPPASLQGLSAEDQKVAMRYASKLPLLEKALAEKTNEGDTEQSATKRQEDETKTDKDLKDFIESLSDVEADILKKYHSHLDQLKEAVHEKRHENDEDRFGDFVKSKPETEPGVQWGSKPGLDSELGLVQEDRCIDGECKPRDPSIKEIARRIAAELRASKGNSVTLADVLKKVREARLSMNN